MLIASYYKEIIVLLLVVAGGFMINRGINKIEEQGVIIGKLSSQLEQQNRAIEGWGERSKDQQKAIENLGVTIVERNLDTQKKIADILKRPTPVTCEESIRYMKENIGASQWKKY